MQKTVSEFLDKYDLHTSAENRYIDLVSEVGEVGKEFLKGSSYGKTSFNITDKTQDEIGDCLFSLLALCNELRIDANKALVEVLDKYETRFREKGHIGSN